MTSITRESYDLLKKHQKHLVALKKEGKDPRLTIQTIDVLSRQIVYDLEQLTYFDIENHDFADILFVIDKVRYARMYRESMLHVSPPNAGS